MNNDNERINKFYIIKIIEFIISFIIACIYLVLVYLQDRYLFKKYGNLENQSLLQVIINLGDTTSVRDFILATLASILFDAMFIYLMIGYYKGY